MSRRAHINKLKQELSRIEGELEELDQIGPEDFEELQGFEPLVLFAAEALKDMHTKVTVTIKSDVMLKCGGGLSVQRDLDMDSYDPWDDTEATYIDLFDEDGEFKDDPDGQLRQLPEVVRFMEEAKKPYARYVDAFNAFSDKHELDDEEREELTELLYEKLGREPDYIYEDEEEEEEEEEDDVPF